MWSFLLLCALFTVSLADPTLRGKQACMRASVSVCTTGTLQYMRVLAGMHFYAL